MLALRPQHPDNQRTYWHILDDSRIRAKMRQCQSCGIIEGGICNETLNDFRGYLICSECKRYWLESESKYCTDISFEDLKRGDSLYKWRCKNEQGLCL